MIIGGTSCRFYLQGKTTKLVPEFTIMSTVCSISMCFLLLFTDADVGNPRAYKWINTINLAKSPFSQYPKTRLTSIAWEQMSIARAFNTTSIWILNIGSLKPLELPTEHFLALAYDIEAWPQNSVKSFLIHWATREFGEDVADEVADIMGKYSVSIPLVAIVPDCLDILFEE